MVLLGLISATNGTPPAAGAMPARNPVLLIHGIHDSAASMKTLTVWLSSQGWEVHSLSLAPNNGSMSLAGLASQVAHYAESTFAPGKKFDLVGFSMGGVVCRYYLQRLDGIDRVERFVSVGAPNHGTWMALLNWHPGGREMRPRSAFINDLNADLRTFDQVQLTVIWTPLDLIIIPANSSRMPVGREVRIWSVAHPLLLLQPSAIRAISQALLETR